MLKVWFSASDTTKGWIDAEATNFVNGLTHEMGSQELVTSWSK